MKDPMVYDRIGKGYALGRRTDPRWMRAIVTALGEGRSVVNVGAGTGSYEPAGQTSLAIEPSLRMLRQRDRAAAPAVQGVAEHLPLGSDAASICLAVLTVHHWRDWRRGLAELRRVAARQVVLAYDARIQNEFWLTREYIPEIALVERNRPLLEDIADELNADKIIDLLVPVDFADGVYPAHWRRPHAYLDERVRQACSAFAQTDPAAVARGIHSLRHDLETGRWEERHRDLLQRDEIDAGFRLILASR